MTAILIGLGAPFWFSTLKKLVALRDLLAPEENKKGKETKPKDQQKTKRADTKCKGRVDKFFAM